MLQDPKFKAFVQKRYKFKTLLIFKILLNYVVTCVVEPNVNWLLN
jgi:uncharacterized membrane protein (DUF485 family)